MTFAELMRWMAWDAVSPIGDERCFDLPGAQVRRLLMAVHGAKDVPTLSELLPFRKHEPATLDQFIATITTDRPSASISDQDHGGQVGAGEAGGTVS